MEPAGVFHTIVNKYVASPLKILFFNFTVPNFKLTFGSYVVVAIEISFSFFSLYTCASQNLTIAIQTALYWCFGVQGLCATYMCYAHGITLQKNIEFLTTVYKANEIPSDNKTDLRRFVQFLMKFSKVFFVIITVSCAVLPLMPVGIYLATDELETFLPVRLPFIRNDTAVGYFLHTIYQWLVYYMAYSGILAADMFVITLTMHYWPLTILFDRAITVLNSETGSSRRLETIRTSTWLKLRVRNIVLMHKDINQYIRDLTTASYCVTTAEVYSSQAGLIILVYCILALKWIPGIFMFVVMFLKLFAFSVVATIIDVLNDKVYASITNIDITNLPENEKKLILFMIHSAQNPFTTKAGVVKLNVETLVGVMKNVYTVAMMLMETL